VQQHLVGEIIGRFEKKGLKLAATKLLQLSEKQACQPYAVHSGKPFFKDLIKFLTSAPILAMV
jgi:nucleoside-diphosphate kinase